LKIFTDKEVRTVNKSRRDVFKQLGFAAVGMGAAATASLPSFREDERFIGALQEIDKLKASFEDLDGRTKLIAKLAITYAGIDFLTDLVAIVLPD
jgi:hypothetical protein